MPGQRKGQRMTDAEKKELPTSLFILSGTNCFRRAAVWFVRWVVFEWVIILTIIGKLEGDIEKYIENKIDRLTKYCQTNVNTIEIYVSNSYNIKAFSLLIKQILCPDFCSKSLFTNAMRLDYVSSDHVRNLWGKQKI